MKLVLEAERCCDDAVLRHSEATAYADQLVELARICLKQAREAKNPPVSAELMHLARRYQMRAASMDNGKLPDIGEEGE